VEGGGGRAAGRAGPGAARGPEGGAAAMRCHALPARPRRLTIGEPAAGRRRRRGREGREGAAAECCSARPANSPGRSCPAGGTAPTHASAAPSGGRQPLRSNRAARAPRAAARPHLSQSSFLRRGRGGACGKGGSERWGRAGAPKGARCGAHARPPVRGRAPPEAAGRAVAHCTDAGCTRKRFEGPPSVRSPRDRLDAAMPLHWQPAVRADRAAAAARTRKQTRAAAPRRPIPPAALGPAAGSAIELTPG
jgi:hypothetical protein